MAVEQGYGPNNKTSDNHGKSGRKLAVRSLTYKLRKIQREQSMQQRKLHKKKGLLTSLVEMIVEKK